MKINHILGNPDTINYFPVVTQLQSLCIQRKEKKHILKIYFRGNSLCSLLLPKIYIWIQQPVVWNINGAFHWAISFFLSVLQTGLIKSSLEALEGWRILRMCWCERFHRTQANHFWFAITPRQEPPRYMLLGWQIQILHTENTVQGNRSQALPCARLQILPVSYFPVSVKDESLCWNSLQQTY